MSLVAERSTERMSRATLAAMVIEDNDGWPKPAPRPKPDDIVAVLMSETMARHFEARCLGQGNTVGPTFLSEPLLFEKDDIPTYVIGVGEISEERT